MDDLISLLAMVLVSGVLGIGIGHAILVYFGVL